MQTKVGDVVLAVVCDGMGGMDQGEIASGYAVEQISCWFYEELPYIIMRRGGQRAIRNSVNRLFYELHNQLLEYGQKKGIRCGTTASVLLLLGKYYYIFHIGDSGIFRLSRKGKKLTQSHVINGNILTRCVGIGKYYKPDYSQGRLKGKSGFLLTTDGFSDLFSLEEMVGTLSPRKALSHGKIEKILKDMSSRGEGKKGGDNMSAIYLYLT